MCVCVCVYVYNYIITLNLEPKHDLPELFSEKNLLETHHFAMKQGVSM